MSIVDALIMFVITWVFSHWVRRNVNTMRAAYYCGVGLMFVFYLGVVEYCGG